MGVGILVLGDDLPVQPFREGGTGDKSEEDSQPEELPWLLEAGTANLPGIAGLLAGIRYIQSIGVNTIAEHEKELARRLVDGLKKLDGIRFYCDPRGTSDWCNIFYTGFYGCFPDGNHAGSGIQYWGPHRAALCPCCT